MDHHDPNFNLSDLSKDDPVILLTIHNDDDRISIQRSLPANLTVKDSSNSIDISPFDLYILDEQALQMHKEKLQTLKEQAGPTFLPVLLLIKNDAPDPNLAFADEIIYTPVSEKILQLRIQILLKQRTYSRLLEEKERRVNQKNMELEKERTFAEDIINSMPIIFYMLDENFNLVHWNKKLEQSLGYTSKEFKTLKPDVYPKSERPLVHSKYQEILERGEAEMEVDVIAKSGEIRHHLITGKKFISGKKTFIMGSGMDITEHRKREDVVRLALKEKEVLLQEIHHRVKNNLAVISGLLQMQRFNSSQKEVIKALADSEIRIKSMALIHEKLYQSHSLSNVDFKPYIEELATTVEETISVKKRIALNFDCDSVSLNINQAVPCALILNELVANAYKHAFLNQETGQITITLNQHIETVFISVADNGMGITDDFRDLKKQSMGYTIIDSLIKQLDASFEIHKNNGTKVSFSFEKQQMKGSSSNWV